MSYLPIMLNVLDKRVLIIGGGEIAEKKAEIMLKYGVKVDVLASKFSDSFSVLNVRKTNIKIETSNEIENYLEGSPIVIIATNDRSLNYDIEQLCAKKGLLYNRVDEAESPFIFPATFESGGVVVSVSTGGRSPSFARFLRDILYEDSRGYIEGLPVIENLRSGIEIKDFHRRAEFFRALLDSRNFWDLISSGKTRDAYEFGLKMSDSYAD